MKYLAVPMLALYMISLLIPLFKKNNVNHFQKIMVNKLSVALLAKQMLSNTIIYVYSLVTLLF